MNASLIEEIAAAVLYEGYLLYPYRASAIKNQQRWNFGVLYPREYAERQTGSDAWTMQTECLLRAPSGADLQVRVRFLHLVAQTIDGQNWQGATERKMDLPPFRLSEFTSRPVRQGWVFPAEEGQQPIEAVVELEGQRLEGQRLGGEIHKMRVNIVNAAAGDSTRDQALMRALVSTHTILSVAGGEFISLLEPPDELRDLAAACKNMGTWPVLVGEDGSRDAMLSSPIILYDYPKIAPESAGALFDGTEIDEILTLRIMTLSEEEKRAMGQTDHRAREILERTESMPPEQFMKLHGVLRGVRRMGDDHHSEAP